MPKRRRRAACSPSLRRKHLKEMPRSDLTLYDALRLYNATSFAMWQYGLEGVFTTHICVAWETLGVRDHAHAARLLGIFLNRATKHFGRERLMEMKPGQRNWRAQSGIKLRYVFVWENGLENGLHTHILATIPWHFAPVFEAWSEKTLTRLTGQPCTPETVCVRAPHETPNVARGWCWLRYCLKQLESEPFGPKIGPCRTLRRILRVWPHRESLPISLPRLTGTSHAIGSGAQKAAGFQSELQYGDPALIYDGHELAQYTARLKEAEQQRWIATLNIY